MQCFAQSHIGLVRETNQDSFTIHENKNGDFLAVVCDGIGGGNAGDVASQLAISYILEHFMIAKSLRDDMEVKRWILRVVQEANDAILEKSRTNKDYDGMGTTCVGVLMTSVGTYIFNSGDSRIYALYDDLVALTEDHSYLNELLAKKEVSEEEAYSHPSRNMLTNALGIWKNVIVDVNKIKDGFSNLLLCSDGLHGFVSLDEVRNVLLEKESAKEKVETLIQMSLDAGGLDNVTVIVIEMDGDTNA